MSQIRFWIMASRPKTLTAAVVPILVGSALVVATGKDLEIWISILAFLCSFWIQIATNLVNDVADFEKGADTSERLGPQRVTQSAFFSPSQVWKAAYICFGLALVSGIPLVVVGGLPILMIGLFSIVAGYAYTSGPFPLAYKGLGDVFVILFFGVVAVMGIYFLQTGIWSILALVAGLQVGILCAVLIAINNLRDISTDIQVGKRTLPVRFGERFAKWQISFFCLFPFVLGSFWWSEGFLLSAWLPFLIFPLAIFISKKIFETKPSPIYNRFLALSGLLHLSFGGLLALGFYL